MRAPWALLGPFGLSWKQLDPLLEASGALLGPLGALLTASWRPLGGLLEALGRDVGADGADFKCS